MDGPIFYLYFFYGKRYCCSARSKEVNLMNELNSIKS